MAKWKKYLMFKTWQEKSNNLVTGSAIKSGHFIPEENPIETAKQIIEFLLNQIIWSILHI